MKQRWPIGQGHHSCQIEMSSLSSMTTPACCRSVARLLRQFGYASVLFSVCGGFRKPQRFRRGRLRPSRHQPGRWIRDRTEAPSQGGWAFCAGHLHDWERQPCRSRGCASIRMPRLSHKAVLREVADRAAQESLGFLTRPGPHAGCRLSRGNGKKSTPGEHFRVWHF